MAHQGQIQAIKVNTFHGEWCRLASSLGIDSNNRNTAAHKKLEEYIVTTTNRTYSKIRCPDDLDEVGQQLLRYALEIDRKKKSNCKIIMGLIICIIVVIVGYFYK
eukprot:240405_1